MKLKPITPEQVTAARSRPWQEFFQRHGIFTAQRWLLSDARRGEVSLRATDVPWLKTAQALERRGLVKLLPSDTTVAVRITPVGMLVADAVEEMEGRRNRIGGRGASPDVDGWEG